MVARLLNHCVKVNAKNYWGETALHVISRSRHNSQGGVQAAQVLLERGADVNSQRKDNWTPLHVASYYGNLELIQMLLQKRTQSATWHKVSYRKYKHPEECGRADHGATMERNRYMLHEIVRCGTDHTGPGRKNTNTDLRRMVYVSHGYSLTGARM
jgi:ankyrin repeat protein